MQVLKAGLSYFALVFGAGFLLGVVRVTFVVPRLGERWAELAEMPLMGVVIVLAARFVVRRHALSADAMPRLMTGGLALLLALTAELILVVAIQGRPVGTYLASRDPVSGGVYLALLGVYAAMPWLLSRGKAPRMPS
jgi:hypothetical protein